MSNILKLAALSFIVFATSNVSAIELVKVQPVSKVELTETAKTNLIAALKLNTVTLDPIQKDLRAQVTNTAIKVAKNSVNNTKAAELAE